MFDKLVESTKQPGKGRSRFFIVTSLIYGFSFTALAVLTIVWANPMPVEALNSAVILMPPPLTPAPPRQVLATTPAPRPAFVSTAIPPTIADPRTVPPASHISLNQRIVPGTPVGPASSDVGVPSPFASGEERDAAPPVPAPSPKATPTPAPTPAVPKVLPLTSTVLQGKALRKVQPTYPAMAKAVRAQGSVPIQITISEEGRVLDATAVSGHPLLREAARQAALQWVFSPTELTGKPVKVTGVIAFNFILN